MSIKNNPLPIWHRISISIILIFQPTLKMLHFKRRKQIKRNSNITSLFCKYIYYKTNHQNLQSLFQLIGLNTDLPDHKQWLSLLYLTVLQLCYEQINYIFSQHILRSPIIIQNSKVTINNRITLVWKSNNFGLVAV